jgi:hypothetical protein
MRGHLFASPGEKVRQFPSSFTFLISIPMIFSHNLDSD